MKINRHSFVFKIMRPIRKLQRSWEKRSEQDLITRPQFASKTRI